MAILPVATSRWHSSDTVDRARPSCAARLRTPSVRPPDTRSRSRISPVRVVTSASVRGPVDLSGSVRSMQSASTVGAFGAAAVAVRGVWASVVGVSGEASGALSGWSDSAMPIARLKPPPASIMTTASSASKSFSRSGPTSRPSAPRYRVSAFASEFACRAGWMLASAADAPLIFASSSARRFARRSSATSAAGGPQTVSRRLRVTTMRHCGLALARWASSSATGRALGSPANSALPVCRRRLVPSYGDQLWPSPSLRHWHAHRQRSQELP